MVALAHLLVENERPSRSLPLPPPKSNVRTFFTLVPTKKDVGGHLWRRSAAGSAAGALLLAVVPVACGGRRKGAVMLPRATLATENVVWRHIWSNGSWRCQPTTKATAAASVSAPRTLPDGFYGAAAAFLRLAG